MDDKVIFVTGIDTNVGKSYATGYIAKLSASEGKRVVTQKFVQTGASSAVSEDIEIHRAIMGVGLLPEDTDGTTCPVRLTYPASPHLAAKLEDTSVDMAAIDRATERLKRRFDQVIIEGAGGLFVPITPDFTTLDYVKTRMLPLIVVSSPRLGSINHTLLTLEACRFNGIRVLALAYNRFDSSNPTICNDTEIYLKSYLATHLPTTEWIDIYTIVIR